MPPRATAPSAVPAPGAADGEILQVPGPEDGLHDRIAYVQAVIGGIKTDKTANIRSDKANYSYDYITDSRIFAEVRRLLAPLRVATYVSVENEERNGTLTKVRIRVTFAYKGESFDVWGVGYGNDPSDKGVGKAITSGTRYIFTKTFLQGGDADPEQDYSVVVAAPPAGVVQPIRQAERPSVPATAPGRSPTQPENTSGRIGRVINAAQLRKLWAQAQEQGLVEEQVRFVASRTLDVPIESVSIAQIPAGKFDDVLENIDKYGVYLRARNTTDGAA